MNSTPDMNKDGLGAALPFPRRLAILGASGTIGSQGLEIVAESDGKLELAMLSVHTNTKSLLETVRQLQFRRISEQVGDSGPNSSGLRASRLPSCVVITDENADRTPLEGLPPEIEVLFGHDALIERIVANDIDIVLSAIVGSAGLPSTLAALEAGKTVALANKESLVAGGQLVRDIALKNGGKILPVDSEHSAIMQCLRSTSGEKLVEKGVDSLVSKLILTASGGPFRTRSLKELDDVRISEALTHPIWKMGKKITIDSATLMNKALELIEARWLFDIDPMKLSVVIHPQSVVHSMVEFVDGSVVAQLGVPDMLLPIQTALYYPHRFDGPARRLDWTNNMNLEFFHPDPERFPAVGIGLEVAKMGGSSGMVVNAANEVAVAAYLEGKLPFSKITSVSHSVLEHHNFEQQPTLQRLFELDAWARKESEKWIYG